MLPINWACSARRALRRLNYKYYNSSHLTPYEIVNAVEIVLNVEMKQQEVLNSFKGCISNYEIVINYLNNTGIYVTFKGNDIFETASYSSACIKTFKDLRRVLFNTIFFMKYWEKNYKEE
jgi:hypothetical protein